MQKNALLVELVNGWRLSRRAWPKAGCCTSGNRWSEFRPKPAAWPKKYNNLAITISTLVTQAVSVGMVIWGVYRIADGTMTMGGLIGSNILVGRAMAPLMQIASLLTRLQNFPHVPAALDLLMQLPSEGQNDNEYVEFGKLDASFSFEDLAFAYPGAEPSGPHGHFRVHQPGEKVGVVGRMGSQVHARQDADRAVPAPGRRREIRRRGHQAACRSGPPGRVGFLPQDVVLFYGTIRDNIALGDPTINDQMILRRPRWRA